ncbi:methyl-accepting chemotaxis protein [Inconstantimicrobium porci]|uniref:Chemotaxis protein n=1 Tax=Inconstantimicrobium porci TaxID=2652291 RepID=A0A7X2MY60_9CLOT|nr:methyl-accepting chemotaxis protein [Inconstantimicrobium porci]MSR91223.1 chemotaxis protein [Inconstantimicrobium porci]
MSLFSRKNKNKEAVNDAAVTIDKEVAFNTVNVDDIKSSVAELHTVYDSLADSINSNNNAISSMADLYDNFTRKINDSDKTLKTFDSDMESLAINITNVHQKVLDTDKIADNGINTIKSLDTSLSNLQEAFTVSSSTVNELVSKLESVNSITDSISQIASQTHLLALNADIEAARAGEAGKGFSVVAGEVRKLAENSKQAVQSITKILEEIKVDILNASNAMNSGTSAITSQHDAINETKTTFDGIKGSIHSAVDEINLCINDLVNSDSVRKSLISEIDNFSKTLNSNSDVISSVKKAAATNNDNIDDLNNTINNLDSKLNK